MNYFNVKVLGTFFTIIFLILSSTGSMAQTLIDTTDIERSKGKRVFQKMIVPTTLILGSTLISGSDFEVKVQDDLRASLGRNYEFKLDDYARYAPIVQMYAADALGVKSKNHWFDQSKNLAMAIVVSDFITFRLKRWLNKKRPDGSKESFPSGHTSFAFTNAGILYQEFKDTSPILAYSGFGFATATGTFRVLNDTHFISDVLVGAGIGILVTELIYLFDPIIRWNPFFKKEKNISFIPRLDGEQYGFYLFMNF